MPFAREHKFFITSAKIPSHLDRLATLRPESSPSIPPIHAALTMCLSPVPMPDDRPTSKALTVACKAGQGRAELSRKAMPEL